jgi:regulator of chromosome condensation
MEEDFVHLSMGEYHMAAVTADGKLYTWGTYKDANGYMGFDGEGNQKQSTPKLYEAIKDKIVSVASNENITYALTASGHVYEWGNTNAIVNRSSTRKTIRDQTKKNCLHPQQVYLGSIKVRKLCQANHGYHMFLFDNQNKVYGWGLNNHGQLGLGDEENRSRPTKLKAFNNVDVEFVCTGQHHSLALSKDHKVYSWGRGDYGQLGHGDDEKRLEPTVIQFFENLEGGDHVVQIACGANHSLALTKNGKIYSWGFGESYQLGHGPKKPKEGEAENPANEEHIPRIVVSRALTNTRAPVVALGGGIHTVVIARKMPKEVANGTANNTNKSDA